MTQVCLISVTPDAEKTIGYIARVSNPNNQDNPKVAGLRGLTSCRVESKLVTILVTAATCQ